MNGPTPSWFLDTRRKAAEGYPLKLRVTFKVNSHWVRKYFHSGVYLTPDEYEKLNSKQRKVRDIKLLTCLDTMVTMMSRAQDIIKDSPFITPDLFQALFSGKYSNASMAGLFSAYMADLVKQERYSSAELYKLTLKALTDFAGDILINNVDADFLYDFERHLKQSVTVATVGIYMRNLRSVFNYAISLEVISGKYYPFGKKGYVIPTYSKVNKALPKAVKSKLVKFKGTEAQNRALAYWKFCYYCNGMNPIDLCHLTKENIGKDVVTWQRQKTKNTRRSERVIIAALNKQCRQILKAYGVGQHYVFGIISNGDSAKARKWKVERFKKQCNALFKEIAKKLSIDPFTFQTARHTFTTMVLDGGATLTDVRDSLGHSDINTTLRYKNSLDIKRAKELSKSL